jgi:hypothetical protein
VLEGECLREERDEEQKQGAPTAAGAALTGARARSCRAPAGRRARGPSRPPRPSPLLSRSRAGTRGSHAVMKSKLLRALFINLCSWNYRPLVVLATC